MEFSFIVGRKRGEACGRYGPFYRHETECCTELKTNALKQVINKYKFKAIFLGIRRDEHGIRAKERYFSLGTTSSSGIMRTSPRRYGTNTNHILTKRNITVFTRFFTSPNLIYGNTSSVRISPSSTFTLGQRGEKISQTVACLVVLLSNQMPRPLKI